MNNRHVSAPYFSIKTVGSTPLFFDFDIFSIFLLYGSPSSAFMAETTLPLLSFSKLFYRLKYVFPVPLYFHEKSLVQNHSLSQ